MDGRSFAIRKRNEKLSNNTIVDGGPCVSLIKKSLSLAFVVVIESAIIVVVVVIFQSGGGRSSCASKVGAKD